MKVCVLGNSHVGALKRGWDSAYKMARNNIDLTFFADRALGLSELILESGLILPRTERLKKSIYFTSGGLDFIDPSSYDVFLIYGLQCKAFIIPEDEGYSKSVIEQSARDHVENTLSFSLIKMVKEVSDKNIYVGHNPLPAISEAKENEGVGDLYIKRLNLINDLVYRPMGCELVPQPLDTIVGDMFTKYKYAKGSKKLSIGAESDDEEHSESDFGHMNDEFGVKWMGQFLKIIR